MNEKFAKRLNEYLANECFDYDMTYSWEWNEDLNGCEVEIKRDDHTQYIKRLFFKYDEVNNNLKIELSEGSFYTTREFDNTVMYFWMLVAPALFPED